MMIDVYIYISIIMYVYIGICVYIYIFMYVMQVRTFATYQDDSQKRLRPPKQVLGCSNITYQLRVLGP